MSCCSTKCMWYSCKSCGFLMQELWDGGNSCFGTFHTISAQLIRWFSSFPLLFSVLALGLADEKEVGCLRHFVMSSTSWHNLVEQHAHFLKVIIVMIISSSNILVSMRLKTLITLLCCSDTLNQRNTNVYLVYHIQTHCYFVRYTIYDVSVNDFSSVFRYDCMGFYAGCSHTNAFSLVGLLLTLWQSRVPSKCLLSYQIHYFSINI